MFEAMDEQGNRINSQLETFQSLTNKLLYCPYCQKQLRVRQGKKRLHFVHVTACTGESSEHQFWKTRLAAYFETLRFKVEIEAVRGRRRFDLFISPGEIGVEIQRSKMSAEEWQRRSLIDQQAGYEVRWIGFHESGGQLLKLDGWMKAAFMKNGYIDLIERGRIVRYEHPLPFAQRLVFCQRVPLSAKQFLFPRPVPQQFLERPWTTLIKNYRLRPFFSSLPSRYVRSPLYYSNLQVSILPSWCFLPLSPLLCLSVHPFEIQVAVYLRLQGTYLAGQLLAFLTECLTRSKVSYELSDLHLLIDEWTAMIGFLQNHLPELFQTKTVDLSTRLEEDQKLAGALRLFVERETGINEVKE